MPDTEEDLLLDVPWSDAFDPEPEYFPALSESEMNELYEEEETMEEYVLSPPNLWERAKSFLINIIFSFKRFLKKETQAEPTEEEDNGIEIPF